MSIIAVIGAQWGDEGKGKIVEHLGAESALVAQCAGGYDIGQSLMAEGERLVFHVIPAGALKRGLTCLLAQGMAIDPRLVLEELDVLEEHHAQHGDLRLDQRAQVVLPHHIELDRLRGEVEGASGGPRRGLGPAYGDKIARRGLRIGDILEPPEAMRAQIETSLEAARRPIEELGGTLGELDAIVEEYSACGDRLRDLVVDGSRLITDLAEKEERVVIEGPFGTMVDFDHGYYPFVVGASTVAGGVCIGTGISPHAIDKIIGVAKAYTTRAGPGPLPSELTGELAARLQESGAEVSPTTARPRRCGMFDVPVLRYAARVNGFDSIALMKLDVWSGIAEIPLCTGYELDGEVADEPPYAGQSRVQPVVEMLEGWTEPIRDVRDFDELPENARNYVARIEKLSGVSIDLISVGPDVAHTIVRRPLEQPR